MAEERPENVLIPGRGPQRLTTHEPSSIVPLQEKERLKHLFPFPQREHRRRQSYRSEEAAVVYLAAARVLEGKVR